MERAELFEYLKAQIPAGDDPRETQSIAGILGEYLLESNPVARKALADHCLERLAQGEPIQYITGSTWFYNLQLSVTPDVLIPRPETEELVEWVIEDHRHGLIYKDPEILDVGTGSGCIALAIKKHIPSAHVAAIDISADALRVAMTNAIQHNVMIEFRIYDILHEELERTFDVIICNPPYITQVEMRLLSTQVRDHEPHLALTTGTEDPLLFYKRLTELGQTHLNRNGRMYMELNEFHAQEIQQLFIATGYETELRKDMHGKWRMLMCRRV